MRTTLNIENNILVVIKMYAEERGISVGQAASDLINRGVQTLPQFETRNGWVVFDRPAGSAVLNETTVRDLENAEHEEEYLRAFSSGR